MKKKDGFSLVELMVVVAIFAFFAALTVPRFLRERNHQATPEPPASSSAPVH